MMYMSDAVKATIDIMKAPADQIKIRSSYNISAMSFNPDQIAAAIKERIPEFEISYAPDFRQQIANSWPGSIDDSAARNNWGWQHSYGLKELVETMIVNLKNTIVFD